MTTRQLARQTLMSAKSTTGIGSIMQVDSFDYIIIQVATASSANFTLKFQGSLSDTAPTFSSAASASNFWTYQSFRNLLDTTSVVAGGTGLTSAGTDVFHIIALEAKALKWLSAEITAISAGNVTVTVVGAYQS